MSIPVEGGGRQAVVVGEVGRLVAGDYLGLPLAGIHDDGSNE